MSFVSSNYQSMFCRTLLDPMPLKRIETEYILFEERDCIVTICVYSRGKCYTLV